MIVRQMTDLVDTGFTAFERDDDLDLMEKAMPANIKLLEAMLANSPHDRRCCHACMVVMPSGL